jgi:HSP20 family protein
MALIRRRNERPTAPTAPRSINRLQDEINRLFDLDWWPEEGFFGGNGVPSLDVEEQDDQVLVKAELPGINKEDLDITVSGNTLTIRGEKGDEEEENKKNYFRRESWYGSFQRSVVLPESVDTENVDAEMKNGILHVTFPKREDTKPKQIDVKVK